MKIEHCKLQIGGEGPVASQLAPRPSPLASPLQWHGPSDWTAEQLGSRAGAAAVLEETKQFVTNYLAARPRRARDLWHAARQQGLARNTVLRAKRKLHIRHTRILTPSGRTGYWLLPGQEVPQEERLPSPPNLEKWLKPLRERFGRGDHGS